MITDRPPPPSPATRRRREAQFEARQRPQPPCQMESIQLLSAPPPPVFAGERKLGSVESFVCLAAIETCLSKHGSSPGQRRIMSLWTCLGPNIVSGALLPPRGQRPPLCPFQQGSGRRLFIRRQRLQSLGGFSLLLLHCLSHVALQDMSGDSGPAFRRLFFRVTAHLSQRRKTKHGSFRVKCVVLIVALAGVN